MFRFDQRHAFRLGLISLLVLTVAGAAHTEFSDGGGGGGAASDPALVEGLVETVADTRRLHHLRDAVTRFYDGAAAHEAGYAQCGECLDERVEPRGLRFVRGGSVEIEGIELEAPQVLVYEPLSTGGHRLIGVEYVVPVATWYEAGYEAPPTLFGRTFTRTNSVIDEPTYVLFVGVERFNPVGGFTY